MEHFQNKWGRRENSTVAFAHSSFIFNFKIKNTIIKDYTAVSVSLKLSSLIKFITQLVLSTSSNSPFLRKQGGHRTIKLKFKLKLCK